MDKKGFSLLELIVAVTILGIAIAGSFSIFVTCNDFYIKSRQELAAVNQASALMEQLNIFVSVDPDRPYQNAGKALEQGNGLSPVLAGMHSVPAIQGASNPGWEYHVTDKDGGRFKEVEIVVDWEV